MRTVDRSQDRPCWEVRAILWLIRRLRAREDFKLRLGHSKILELPTPELYLEVIYGNSEVVVFDMNFDLETWPKIRDSMSELQWMVEREYGEVKRDE